jgi:hypothetical protein
MRSALLLALSLALAACGKNDLQSAAPGPCTRMGQNCEFLPGKLGTCVVKNPGSDSPPASSASSPTEPTIPTSCLVCQSQH